MERECRTCRVIKSLDDFYVARKNKVPNPSAYSYECKVCCIARVKANHNPERARENELRRKYNLTLEEYQEMFDNQGGVCASCQKPETGRWERLCVDHDHKTGKVSLSTSSSLQSRLANTHLQEQDTTLTY